MVVTMVTSNTSRMVPSYCEDDIDDKAPIIKELPIKFVLKDQQIDCNKTDEELGIVSAAELLNGNLEEIPMLIPPIFPKKGIAMLCGSSDSTKSMFLRNMAWSITTGRDFMGWKCNAIHHRVLFVSTEDDRDSTEILLKRHNILYNDASSDLIGLKFLFSSVNLMKKLNKILSNLKFDMVIIDAYSDVFSGTSTNDATQVREFLSQFKDLSQTYGCLVLFLHHTGKGKQNYAPSKDNLIGSQSIEAAARLVIELKVDKDDDRLRHFCIVKGNYLGREWKRESFVYEFDEKSFTFKNTGIRKPFEELAKDCRKPKDGTDKPKKITQPDQLSEDEHRIFLKSHITEEMTKNQINGQVHEKLGVGKTNAKDWGAYYVNKGLVTHVGYKNSNPTYIYPSV